MTRNQGFVLKKFRLIVFFALSLLFTVFIDANTCTEKCKKACQALDILYDNAAKRKIEDYKNCPMDIQPVETATLKKCCDTLEKIKNEHSDCKIPFKGKKQRSLSTIYSDYCSST